MSTAAPAPRSISKSEFVDSTALLADPAALQARAAEDGYLFFKRRLPAEELLAMRAEMLAIVDKYGWRQPGQDALGGLIDYDGDRRVLLCRRGRGSPGSTRGCTSRNDPLLPGPCTCRRWHSPRRSTRSPRPIPVPPNGRTFLRPPVRACRRVAK